VVAVEYLTVGDGHPSPSPTAKHPHGSQGRNAGRRLPRTVARSGDDEDERDLMARTPCNHVAFGSGSDGTRTRDLRRDRPRTPRIRARTQADARVVIARVCREIAWSPPVNAEDRRDATFGRLGVKWVSDGCQRGG